MLKKFKYVIISLLVIGLLATVYFRKQEKKLILVVYSYNTDLKWVKKIEEGIQRNLSGYPIRRHYMDLKNHSKCEFLRRGVHEVQLVIESLEPQVVILVDDLAQALVGANYLRFREGYSNNKFYDEIAKKIKTSDCSAKRKEELKVDRKYFGLENRLSYLSVIPYLIFAGVNGGVEQYGYPNAVNVTGIFEHKYYNAILEVIRNIHQSSSAGKRFESIQLLGDTSATSGAEGDFFKKFERGPFPWKKPIAVKNPEEWREAINTANKNKSMLLIANYLQIPFPKNPSGEEDPSFKFSCLIQWTEEKAEYPILGLSTAFVEHGGMVTIAIAGVEQGETASKLALNIIEGKKVPGPPYLEAKQFIVGMNQELIEENHLTLPLVYGTFSRDSNNFYEKKILDPQKKKKCKTQLSSIFQDWGGDGE